MRPTRRYRLLGLSLLLGFALALMSCTYYGQALRGGLEIVCKKRSIERLLARPDLDAAFRERLLRVKGIRLFAVTALALPGNVH